MVHRCIHLYCPSIRIDMSAFRYVVWTVVSLLSIQRCWGVEDNPSSNNAPQPAKLSVQGNWLACIKSIREQYAHCLPHITHPVLDDLHRVVPHLESVQLQVIQMFGQHRTRRDPLGDPWSPTTCHPYEKTSWAITFKN